MTDQLKNMLIGLFVVTAIVIAVSMILFLEPTVGDGKQILQVRFANIAGIQIGTRVTYAGKPVGEVVAIQEVHNARLEPTDDAGKVYLYQLGLKVDSHVAVYTTDEVAIRSTGLMGERSIAILPKAATTGAELRPIGAHVMYASSIDPIENAFTQIGKASNRLQDALTRFDNWFDRNQDALSASIQNLTHISHEMATGDGTVGRLINSDDFYLRVSALLGKVDTLMNDVNHYGLLFQYDKGWQRSRTRRANQLQALDTPSEFRTYFETEVDTVQTALSRITILLEKASDSDERQKIMQSESFRTAFATLLRQVQSLSDSLRLYNEAFSSPSPANE